MTQLPDFKSINERDQYFLEHAEMFTVVRRLSPYSIDRYGCRNFSAAERLATELAAKFQKPYMIYAVIGPYDSFVEAVHPKRSNGQSSSADISPSNRSPSPGCGRENWLGEG